jgi:hypothetical protein
MRRFGTRRRQVKTALGMLLLGIFMFACFQVLGAIQYTAPLITRPDAYAVLRTSGVPVSVVIDSCDDGGKSGIITCTGSFTLNGHSYDEDIDGIDVVYTQGAVLSALVDPTNPSVVYPDAAVYNNDGVGLTGHALFGLIFALLGLVLLVLNLRTALKMRKEKGGWLQKTLRPEMVTQTGPLEPEYPPVQPHAGWS